MLAITQNAAEAIKSITDAPEFGDEAGLRVVAAPGDERPELTLSIADGPEEEDEELEEGDVRVFLEPDAASYLDDKILDARYDESNRRLSFVVHAP